MFLSGKAFSKTNCLKTRENNCIENNNKILNSYEDLDLKSKPKKILSQINTKSLWNAYKKAPKCFEHPTYGHGVGYKLKKIHKKEFMNNSWISPFYKYEEDNKHKIKLGKTYQNQL